MIGIFVNQLLQQKPLSVFGDGTQTRAFTYIADIAGHVARSVDVQAAYNRVFNIGASRAVSLNELVRVVGEVFGCRPGVRHLPPRNEVLHAFSDHSSFTNVFGVQEETPLDVGVRRTVAWARQHGVRKTRTF